MKNLWFLLLLSLPATAAPPAPPAKLLRQFVRALTDSHTSDSVLIARFMCPDVLLQRNNPRADTARMWLHGWRTEMQKQAQLSPRQVRRARVLPSRQVPHPTFHMLGGEDDAYVMQVEGRPNLYFLVHGQQIASFLLLNQGGEAYFVDFCR